MSRKNENPASGKKVQQTKKSSKRSTISTRRDAVMRMELQVAKWTKRAAEEEVLQLFQLAVFQCTACVPCVCRRKVNVQLRGELGHK